MSVALATAVLIGLGFAAVGSHSSTSSRAYSAQTYCARDVPIAHSLWVQSHGAVSPTAWQETLNTMSIHAAELGDPYGAHVEALTMLISAAEQPGVGNRTPAAAIDADVTNAWAQVMHDCHH